MNITQEQIELIGEAAATLMEAIRIIDPKTDLTVCVTGFSIDIFELKGSAQIARTVVHKNNTPTA